MATFGADNKEQQPESIQSIHRYWAAARPHGFACQRKNDDFGHAEKHAKKVRQEVSSSSNTRFSNSFLNASTSSASHSTRFRDFLASEIVLNFAQLIRTVWWLSKVSEMESVGFWICSCIFAVTQICEGDISQPTYFLTRTSVFVCTSE